MRFLRVAIVADRLNRATFESFHTKGDVVLGGRLLVDEGVTSIIVARKEVGSCLTTEIAVNTLLIDIELTFYVLFPLIGFVCHRFRHKMDSPTAVKRGRDLGPKKTKFGLAVRSRLKDGQLLREQTCQATKLHLVSSDAFRPVLHA